MELAQKLYDRNLSRLLDVVRQGRRGLYRVMMDSTGLIQSISPCRLGPPQPNCFTFYVPGNHEKPRFGKPNALCGVQVAMASFLEQDVAKVLRSNELAYALQQHSSPVLDRAVKVKVDELVSRFGQLPEPALKHQADLAKTHRLQSERQAEEKRKVWSEEIPNFEQLLRLEMEREAKVKARCG